MLIQPYSDMSLYAPNGKLALTAANFPTCKMFFPFDEPAGAKTFTDKISGGTITITNGATNGTGALVLTGANTGLVLPTAFNPATYTIMFTAVYATLATIVCKLNAPTGTTEMSFTSTTSLVNDGTTSFVPSAHTTVNQGIAVSCKGFTASSVKTNTATTNTYTAGTPVTGTPSFIAGPDRLTLTGGGEPDKLFGLGVFIFPTAPSDMFLQAMLSWHNIYWRKDTSVSGIHKGLYPGLFGLPAS